MKNYTMFNFDYLFGDYFANVSPQAKLLYIKMNFYAVNGFVASPLTICDELGIDKSCLTELIRAEEVLTLKGRNEVFITSYFIHNKGLNPKSWTMTPYKPYWWGHLFIKSNGIATFKKQNYIDNKRYTFETEIEVDEKNKTNIDDDENCENEETEQVTDWDELMSNLEKAGRTA